MKPMNVLGSKFRLPDSWSNHIRAGSSRSASVGLSNGTCATTLKEYHANPSHPRLLSLRFSKVPHRVDCSA
jgi:hypothetical protein